MRRLMLAGLFGLALSVTACDQVRLPGLNPAQEAGAPAEAESTNSGYTEADLQPTPEQIEAERAEAEAREAEAETPALEAETPPPETPPGETPAAATSTAPGDGGMASLSPTSSLLPPAADIRLGAVNAARCALPEGAPPTLTAARAAGATQLEEPMMGAEAVNAAAASLSAFPGIVKLEPRRAEPSGLVASGHCSALRIAPNWLVTAAHCIDEPFDELRVIGEAANLRSPAAKRLAGDYAICHAGYQGTENGYANDIALIHVSPSQATAMGNVPIARFGATQRPLAPANYPSGDMAGWGLTRFDGQLSNDLLSTRLKITDAGPAAITVASENGAGPCIGDSGGPLYVTEEDGSKIAVGILSVVEQNRTTGHFCEGDYNGRYTNLQGFAGWVAAVTALCETDEAACR